MPFIFLSYSHKDSEFANRLADSLEAKGLEVWIDERIDYGSSWPQVIQENLDRCTAFVVVMTPDSYESEWVQAELTRARRLRKPTFPLLLEGDVWLALEATHYVDVRGGKLPPARFYTRLASALMPTSALVSPPSTSWRERLQTELGELERRYDNLTSRIAAVDTDLSRELDSEHRLVLEERRVELATRRAETSAVMAQIERELTAQGEKTQDVQPLLVPKAVLKLEEVAQSPGKAELGGRIQQVAQPSQGGGSLVGTLLRRSFVVTEEERVVVYRRGRFYRIAGPGWIFLWPFEHIERTFHVRDQPMTVSVAQMFLYDIPIGFTFSFWARVDPVAAAGGNPTRLKDLVIFNDSERTYQICLKIRDSFTRRVAELEKNRPLSDCATIIDKIIPILPGSPECNGLLIQVRGDLQRTLPLVGVYLDVNYPVNVTEIILPSQIMQGFTRRRTKELLRLSFPNLPKSQLAQMAAAIRGLDET